MKLRTYRTLKHSIWIGAVALSISLIGALFVSSIWNSLTDNERIGTGMLYGFVVIVIILFLVVWPLYHIYCNEDIWMKKSDHMYKSGQRYKQEGSVFYVQRKILTIPVWVNLQDTWKDLQALADEKIECMGNTGEAII